MTLVSHGLHYDKRQYEIFCINREDFPVIIVSQSAHKSSQTLDWGQFAELGDQHNALLSLSLDLELSDLQRQHDINPEFVSGDLQVSFLQQLAVLPKMINNHPVARVLAISGCLLLIFVSLLCGCITCACLARVKSQLNDGKTLIQATVDTGREATDQSVRQAYRIIEALAPAVYERFLLRAENQVPDIQEQIEGEIEPDDEIENIAVAVHPGQAATIELDPEEEAALIKRHSKAKRLFNEENKKAAASAL